MHLGATDADGFVGLLEGTAAGEFLLLALFGVELGLGDVQVVHFFDLLLALKDASVEQLADVLMRALHGLIGLALAEVDLIEDLLGLTLTLARDFFLQVIFVTLLQSGQVDLEISAFLVDLNLLGSWSWILRISYELFFVSLAIVLTRAVGLFLLPVGTHSLIDLLYLL